MANRPVYVALEKFPYFAKIDVEFKFFPGFSAKQKKLSIESLHKAFSAAQPAKSVLEISSKSEVALGVKLSAFNLQIALNSQQLVSVESAFQSSKVFERGGPFQDLLLKTSREAKKDVRLKNSGRLIAFNFLQRNFPLEPKTFFYDWLYITALNQHDDLKSEIMNYDSFTDIEFNPKKSLNCQAQAAAIFVGLNKADMLTAALDSQETFLQTVCNYFSPAKNLS